MKFALMFLFAFVLAAPIAGHADETERNGQDDFLIRGVFASGRLWILSDQGDLFSITEGQSRSLRIDLPEPVLDICLTDGSLIAITGARAKATQWTVHKWTGDSWVTTSTAPASGDRLVAAECGKTGVRLLTSRRLIDTDKPGQRPVRLRRELFGGSVTSTLGTSTSIFVGVNRGEWGGGLLRIDRRTGDVAKIERKETKNLCAGPLNAACDPVNGIAVEPWRMQCVVAAIGLVHFFPSGRLVEVCGNDVRQIYSMPFGEETRAGSKSEPEGSTKVEEPFASVAFFGLTSDSESLWAAGIDGLHHIGPSGALEVVPMPKVEKIGDFYVAFLPKIVLVLTSINQRVSVSGAVPMIVAR